MRTRRQFLGLLAGLPLVGRVLGHDQAFSTGGGFYLPEKYRSEASYTTHGQGYSYYIWYDRAKGEIYTELDGTPIENMIEI